MNKVIEIIDSDDDSHTATSTLNTSMNSSMEQDDNQQSQSRRRRRKSVLHAMPDPDMQFQTISIEDDDDDLEISNTMQINSSPKQPIANYLGSANSARTTSLKTLKVTPKILAPKGTSCEEIVYENYEKFLDDPETINDVYAIAEERARINYLFAVNGIPEINFALFTRPERLQFQFEERLKQRRTSKKLG